MHEIDSHDLTLHLCRLRAESGLIKLKLNSIKTYSYIVHMHVQLNWNPSSRLFYDSLEIFTFQLKVVTVLFELNSDLSRLLSLCDGRKAHLLFINVNPDIWYTSG